MFLFITDYYLWWTKAVRTLILVLGNTMIQSISQERSSSRSANSCRHSRQFHKSLQIQIVLDSATHLDLEHHCIEEHSLTIWCSWKSQWIPFLQRQLKHKELMSKLLHLTILHFIIKYFFHSILLLLFFYNN